ncbi:MAG: isopeptide-forming domain-containing fimbrial protein [Patulibacter minatonensis]
MDSHAPNLRARLTGLLAVVAAVLLQAIAPASAGAAARTFVNSYAQTLHGDIAAIGNANSTCRAGWSTGCTPMALGNGNSNNAYGALVDVDGVAATTNSSQSTLSIPAGSTIRYARLLWGSAGDGTDNNGERTVQFDVPDTAGPGGANTISYQAVSATYASECGALPNAAGANARGFACSRDVTSLVQGAGSGTYTVGAIEQRATGNTTLLPDHWSGWSLYVVFERAAEPLRRIVLSDGFVRVGNGEPNTITATGFVAPASGTVTAQLTYTVGEGDSEISGDNATFGTRTLDAATPPNLMSSQIRGLSYSTGRNPNYVNHYGFDMQQTDVTGAIANGATSASFSFTSTQDVYYPFGLGIAIDLGEPNLQLVKTLTDVNGGVVEPGDVIEYQIVATNTGNDGAAGVTITDPIPSGTAYVPGSMQVTAGANTGAKTDAAGDDQGTFAGNQVTIRAGTGANATTGGIIAANGGTTTVRFRVTIDAGADEGVPLVNTASASYTGQTSLLAYADPSSVAATPVRRADMVVAQTLSPNLTTGVAGSVTLTATNIGGSTTHGQPVTLTATVPTGVAFGGLTSAPGWTCNVALPTITCTRTDTLGAGASYPDVVYALTPSQGATTATFNAQVAGGNQVNTSNDTDADPVTFARRADLRLTKSVSRATGRVGDTLSYTLTATNLGPSNTTGVVVVDTVPSGITVTGATSTAGTCTTAGQTVTCNVGGMVNGATATITVNGTLAAASAGQVLVNSATISGADPDPTSSNDTATATTTVDQAADLQLTKTVSPATVNPGAAATWTITVRNNGPGAATGVQVVDTLPSGVTRGTVTSTTGSCGTGSTFTCTLNTLASGATATITVPVTPLLSAAGTTVTNSATATTTAYDGVSANDTATSALAIAPAADLRIAKTVDKPAANVDEVVTWTITATNDGPSAAAGVTLTDNAPAGITLQTVTPGSGVSCSTTGQTVACTVAGAMASGATRTVQITGVIDRASAGSPRTNSATVASSTYDPQSANNLSSVTTNVSAATDLRVTKTADRSNADVGDVITWTVTARNDGPSAATGVVVTDVLPSGVAYGSSSATVGTCTPASGQVVCTVGALASGATSVITIRARVTTSAAETPQQNVATITGSQFDPETANNSTNVTTTINAAADVRVSKTVDRATANVGDTLTYTLVARNDGPSTATSVTLTDALPAGLTPTGSPTITGGTCAWTANTLNCTLASLASGGARTVTVQGIVGAGAAGSVLSNTATVGAAQLDPDPSNNTSAPADTVVRGVADLSLTKTVDRGTANVGDTLTYTLQVHNAGPQPAIGTVLTDNLPAGVSRLGVTTPQGSCPAGTPIVCNLGTVAVGATVTVTITARVDLAAAGATATNNASVTSTQDDLTPGDRSASAQTVIAPAADLRLTKSADKGTADVGERITWTVAITNDGPSSATGVVIDDTIPSGVQLDPVAAQPGLTCTVSGGVVACSVTGALASGDSRVLTLSGVVRRAAAETPQQNVASVAGSQLDPNPGNNSYAVVTSINRAADLVVSKTVDRATANVGDTLEWTVAVRNDGPSGATGVRLIDDLPAGTTYVSSTASIGACALLATQLSCGPVTLGSAQSQTVTIRATVDRAAAESPVSNAARASGTEFDPDTANNLATATTTVGPSTDLQLTKSVDRTSAAIGDTLTYTLTARNDGPSAATGVVVSDALPAGLNPGSATSTAGSCTTSGQTVTCAVGTLASGATATITIRGTVRASAASTTVSNSATITGAQSDPRPADNAAGPTSTQVAAAADLRVTASVDDPTGDVGDLLTYRFTIDNLGPDAATNIALPVSLPSGITLQSISAPGMACTPLPTGCTGGALAAGGSPLVVTAVVRVLPAASGQDLTLSGTAGATQSDPDAANNAASATSAIAPAADLVLTKTVDRAAANIGDALGYTLTVRNDGPATATGVRVTDTLPAGLTPGAVTTTTGTCATAGQTITCTIGALANGASATVTIGSTVRSSAAASTISNTAQATADQHDPTPGDATTLPATTAIGSAADLVVSQVVDRLSVNVGSSVRYTVTIRNDGPQTATGITLGDDLPTGVTVTSIVAGQGTCGTGDPFSCALGSLASGASTTVTITATITGAAESTFANTASATATQFDPNTSNNGATAATSTGPAADLKITKTADRAAADVGDTITWTVTATNAGPSTATGVTITDTAPAGVTLGTPAAPSGTTCSTAGQVVSCVVSGSLASGATRTITLTGTVRLASAGSPLTNAATVAGNEFDPNTADNLSSVTTNVNAAADLRIAKSVDRPTANVGDSLTWSVIATNDGPSAAAGVVVTDDLPAGTTYVSSTSTQGACAAVGSQLVCTVGGMASTASVTITIRATVKTTSAESPVTNAARVTSGTFDPDPADNLSTATTTVGPAGDLSITKTVDRTAAQVGDVLTYTLVARNDGPSAQTGVAVSDTLPTTLQLAGAPTTTAGTCAVVGQNVTCTVGGLASGATATVTIRATVRASASATTVGNTAQISGTRFDPTPANDTTAAATTTVGPAADLAVTHTVDRPSLNVGDTATYTVVVRNNGPETATAVRVSDDLPSGITLLGGLATTAGSCTAGDPVVCTIPSLAPGATATITVPVRIDSGVGAAFTATATATAAQHDPTPANNAASASTSTGPSADLALTKTADKATADVGETITWTLAASNAGPSPATGVTITDTIPAGITGVTAAPGAGVSCTVASPTVSCVVPGPWPSGSPRTVTLTGVVARSSAGSPLANSATIAGAEHDPSLANNTSTVTTSINDAADLRVTKTADRAAANVGDTITWTVTATNDGPSTAAGVTITDDLPAGTTLLSATATQGSCTTVGGQEVCTIGALGSTASAQVTLTARVNVAAAETPVVNAARVTSPTFDPETANNISSVTTTVGKSVDLSTTAAADRATADIGDELTYTFVVRNAGPSSATGTTFTQALPAHTTYRSSSATQGGCTIAGTTLTCATGTIPSNGAVTVTVRVTTDTSASGTTIDARGTASAVEPDRDSSNDRSPIVSTVIAPAADLRVTVDPDRSTAAVGDAVTYLVTVTNAGPATATNVQLANALPANATVVGLTPSQGACSTAGASRTCALGSIAAGASATITVVVSADPAAAGTVLTDSASVTADQHDPVAANNAAANGTAVGEAADLRVTKTVDRPTADVGDTVTWTIAATNLGPRPATGVTLTDLVPPGVTIQSITATAGSCSGTGPISCAIGGLAVGADATITVVGRLRTDAGATALSAPVSITGNELDPNLANNTASVTTTVGPAADLRLTKLVSTASPAIGDAVSWTIQAFNDGPQGAAGVTVTDVVPAGATIRTVNSSQGTCTQAGQAVTCSLGALAAGGSATVTISATVATTAGGAVLDNAATVASTTRDPDTSNNAATARATAGPAADLQISLTPDRTAATVGQVIGWTATVGNAGPQTSAGTVVTVDLPAGLTGVKATVPGGTCTVSGNGRTVTCQLADLPVGASVDVALSGTAGRETAERTLAASAVVTGSRPDPVPANNATAATANVTIPAAVDLVVTKEADKPTAGPGEQVTITTTVKNNGPSTATGVVLTDTIPEGVTVDSVTPSQGTCTVTQTTITCDLGSLPDGAVATVKLVVTVQQAGAATALLSAGNATSSEHDTDGANNAAQVSTPNAPQSGRAPSAKIELTKSVDQASPQAGGTVVWTITAKNVGDAAATGVRITDELPAGLDYVSTKAAGTTCTRNARTVLCVVSMLAPGRSVQIRITTKAAAAGVEIANVASATAANAGGGEVLSARAASSLRASGAPFLVLGVKPLEAYSRPGKRVRIAVKLTNVGQATAKGTTGCFTLPKGVVLLRKPAGLRQRGAKFCMVVPALATGRNRRFVLSARVVGSAGTSRPRLSAASSNSRVKMEAYPLVIRGRLAARGDGVTG